MVCVEFGCLGHGKGPWDGLGAMAKTKISRDLIDMNEMTPSGRITSPLEVAQHLHVTFCTEEWLLEHIHMKINQVVVMYLDFDEISRPASPPDVSPCKVILSSNYFLSVCTPHQYAMQAYSCWCNACSCVRSQGYGTAMGWWGTLEVPGCARSKLTVWKEGHFIVEPKVGIVSALSEWMRRLPRRFD